MFRHVRTYRRSGGIDFCRFALYVCTQLLSVKRSLIETAAFLLQGIGCCFYVHGILQKLRGQVTKDEVLLPAEVAAATAYPPEEPSESPRHFAASMDESVIVGYYTLKSAALQPSAVCKSQGKDKNLWQEMME